MIHHGATMRDDDYPFFSYFHRAKREGLTDTEAYHWAITEDIYDANGSLLGPNDPKPNGVCYHPQYAVDKSPPSLCLVCGTHLRFVWAGKNRNIAFYCAEPCKIPTRNESAMTFFAAIAARAEEAEPETGTDT